MAICIAETVFYRVFCLRVVYRVLYCMFFYLFSMGCQDKSRDQDQGQGWGQDQGQGQKPAGTGDKAKAAARAAARTTTRDSIQHPGRRGAEKKRHLYCGTPHSKNGHLYRGNPEKKGKKWPSVSRKPKTEKIQHKIKYKKQKIVLKRPSALRKPGVFIGCFA